MPALGFGRGLLALLGGRLRIAAERAALVFPAVLLLLGLAGIFWQAFLFLGAGLGNPPASLLRPFLIPVGALLALLLVSHVCCELSASSRPVGRAAEDLSVSAHAPSVCGLTRTTCS
jgi:hypothetical protein